MTVPLEGGPGLGTDGHPGAGEARDGAGGGTRSAAPLIRLVGVTKRYRTDAREVPVLHGVSLDVGRGEFVAIMGPSGSGKTTLMNVVGCLDTLDDGRYAFAGQDVGALDADRLAALRNRHVGFVFQSFNLVARMDATRNVELPMIYAGLDARTRTARARERLADVGLGERTDHLPNQLSGGQQQRVAIARALANDPELLIADEPTGSLDSATGEEILALFDALHRSGRTIVMVTHEDDVAARAERVVRLQDGVVVADGPP